MIRNFRFKMPKKKSKEMYSCTQVRTISCTSTIHTIQTISVGPIIVCSFLFPLLVDREQYTKPKCIRQSNAYYFVYIQFNLTIFFFSNRCSIGQVFRCFFFMLCLVQCMLLRIGRLLFVDALCVCIRVDVK